MYDSTNWKPIDWKDPNSFQETVKGFGDDRGEARAYAERFNYSPHQMTKAYNAGNSNSKLTVKETAGMLNANAGKDRLTGLQKVGGYESTRDSKTGTPTQAVNTPNNYSGWQPTSMVEKAPVLGQMSDGDFYKDVNHLIKTQGKEGAAGTLRDYMSRYGYSVDDIRTKFNAGSGGASNSSLQASQEWLGVNDRATAGDRSTSTNRPTLATVEPIDTNKRTAFDELFNRDDTLVESRMEGLLTSPLMDSAREEGRRQAHTRGLLNSNLAGQYATKSVMDSALPIAQQDAKMYSDLEQARDSRSHDLSVIGAQEASSSRLSAQDAEQQRKQSEYNALVNSGLSAQEARQSMDAAEYNALVNSGLSEQEAKQSMDAAEYNALVNSGLSEQEARQTMELSKQQEAAKDFRYQMEIDFNNQIKDKEISANEKEVLTNKVTTLGTSYQENVAGILVRDDLSAGAKNDAITSLQNVYKTNLASIGSITDYEVSWELLIPDEGTNTEGKTAEYIANEDIANENKSESLKGIEIPGAGIPPSEGIR